jgi:AraC-like DNA-binding protein
VPKHGLLLRFAKNRLRYFHFVVHFGKECKMEIEYQYYFKNQYRPLGSLSLHEVASMNCPASFVLPIDQTDAYAVYLVDEGKGVYTLGNAEFPVKKNDIFVMYPNVPVRCVSDKDEPLKMFALSFDGMDARLLLNAAGFEPKNPVQTLDPHFAGQVTKVFDGIYVWRGQEIYSTVQSTAMIYLLLSSLVKNASVDQSAMPPGWTGTVHFQKAVDYIAINYSRPIIVGDIAKNVNLSRSRLYRVFMQQIFISPQQYLTEYRMRQALNLLEKRKGSIKEIANAVGIDDPQYFSNLFKQVIGRSPKNYMKDVITDKSEKNDTNDE